MKKRIIELYPQQDISKLDWQNIKNASVDGVMIPIGSSDYYGRINVNDYAKSCIEAAGECGLAVGVMADICCKDAFSAHEAAYNTVEIIKEFKSIIKLGIAYGFFEKKRSCLIEQGTDGLTDTALALLFETQRLGYRGIIHTDFSFADTYMDIERIKGRRFWGDPHWKWDSKLFIKCITETDEDYISELSCFGQNVLGE